MRVILDTGPWVALLDRSEARHSECINWLEHFKGEIYTSEAVLTGFWYFSPAFRPPFSYPALGAPAYDIRQDLRDFLDLSLCPDGKAKTPSAAGGADSFAPAPGRAKNILPILSILSERIF